MRFHIVMLKTLKDLFSLKRNLIFLAICMIPVIFISSFFARGAAFVDPSIMSIPMQTQVVGGFFFVFSFLWFAGIPISLLATITCANFISKEEADGTMLLLVSKPVRRYEIILGKFLAFLVNVALLELIILLSTSLLIFNFWDIDPSVFNYLLGIVPYIFLYSILVAFIFGAISTALSVLSRSSTKIVIILVALIILIYFGFPLIRTWTVNSGIYDKYNLDYFDVNYHLGNCYILFLSNYRIMPDIQGTLGQFTGVYEAGLGPGRTYDPDLGAMPPSLELKAYTHPVISLGIWITLSILILMGGLLRFERKEIY